MRLASETISGVQAANARRSCTPGHRKQQDNYNSKEIVPETDCTHCTDIQRNIWTKLTDGLRYELQEEYPPSYTVTEE